MSGRQLDDAMMDAGHGRNAARDARKYAVKNGHVITEPGKARAVIHKLPADSAPVRHSAPEGVAHHASESGEECASAPIDGARTLTTLAPASNPESAPATDKPESAPALIETIQSLLPGAAIIDEESEKPSLWEPPKVTSDPNLDRHAPCPICGESFYGPAGSEQCIEDHPEDAE